MIDVVILGLGIGLTLKGVDLGIYLGYAAWGKYGPRTQRAIKRLQRKIRAKLA